MVSQMGDEKETGACKDGDLCSACIWECYGAQYWVRSYTYYIYTCNRILSPVFQARRILFGKPRASRF